MTYEKYTAILLAISHNTSTDQIKKIEIKHHGNQVNIYYQYNNTDYFCIVTDENVSINDKFNENIKCNILLQELFFNNYSKISTYTFYFLGNNKIGVSANLKNSSCIYLNGNSSVPISSLYIVRGSLIEAKILLMRRNYNSKYHNNWRLYDVGNKSQLCYEDLAV